MKVDEKVQPSLNETSSPLCNHPSNAHCKLKQFFSFVSLFAIQKVENRWLWMLWCMSWNSSHMYLWRVEKYLWTDSPPNLVDILHVFLFCTNFSTESKCTVRLPCLLKRQQEQNVGKTSLKNFQPSSVSQGLQYYASAMQVFKCLAKSRPVLGKS